MKCAEAIHLASSEDGSPTITDVFVKKTRLDGSVATTVVRPSKPYAQLRGERTWYRTAEEYVGLGFHHILQGVDHLLFVLGLLLIVNGRMMLLKTVTGFTVAHSITLAIATLGYANVPGPPLNAAIALSIFFLGPEVVRTWRGESSLTIRYPWVVAFLFGLLHGFGFASGLSTAGMPKAELPLALLFFNLRVAIRSSAHRFGGSHAQRDLLDLTWIEAALRSGDRPLAAALAAERAAMRPASPLARRFVARAAS